MLDVMTALIIRIEYLDGKTATQISTEYEVSYGTVNAVVNGSHRLTRGLPSLARERNWRP